MPGLKTSGLTRIKGHLTIIEAALTDRTLWMKSVEAISSPLFADSVVMTGEMMARTPVTAIVINSVVRARVVHQQEVAAQSKKKQDASGRFRRPIVTEITPASTFHKAEEYHQAYLAKRGRLSCHL